MANFTGTSGNDIFTGGAEDDYAHGGAGNDSLSGADGIDRLDGGTGADTLNGGNGDDALASGPVQGNWDGGFYVYWEKESLDTGTEKDILVGGAGEDWLWAGYGDDVDGGVGIDHLSITFLGATSGITADFSLGTLTIGGGTIKNVESLTWVQGSNYDDYIKAYDNAGGYGQFTELYGMGGNDHLVASYYTRSLDGGDGDDIVDGRGSQYLNDVIGGAGDDTLYTNTNTFSAAHGGAGNDTIYAHGAISGGSGNDTIFISQSYYPGSVSGDEGDDTITASLNGSIIAGGSGADTLNGSAQGDSLASGSFVENSNEFADDLGLEHDVLNAGGGDDRLSIGYGDDADGGAGSDTLRLSLGGLTSGVVFSTVALAAGGPVTVGGGTIQNIETLEFLRGTDFADTITAGTQESLLTVEAGAGNDVVISRDSSVHMLGGVGNDRLVSGAAGDLFDGGEGTDTVDYQKATAGVTVTLANPGGTGTGAGGDQLIDVENIYGSAYADTLTGNDGANLLKGQAGSDYLYGGAGNDTLDGGVGGDDRLYGGLGNDTYLINDAADLAIENGGEGTDTVKASVTLVGALRNNVENLTLTGSAAIDGTGNSLANVLTGNNAANALYGGAGDDQLIGAGGTDLLDGQEGSDLYIVAAGSHHSAGEFADSGVNGIDEVRFSATSASTLTLHAGDTGIERVVVGTGTGSTANSSGTTSLHVNASEVGNGLIMVGNAGINVLKGTSFADTVLGAAGNDQLYGNDGNDMLDGGTGADKLYGGLGDDAFVVDNPADYLVENLGEGTDAVIASISYALRANFENLVLTGSEAVNGTGNADGNAITGNSAVNYLYGRAGNDTLDGGDSADTLKGEEGDDGLIGGAGRDLLYGGTGSDVFFFDDGHFGGATSSTADRILDYSRTESDYINLAQVDADATSEATDEAFSFIGTDAFTNVAGQLRYEQISGSTFVQGDTNGDGIADFWIRIDGLHTFDTGDFIL